MSTMFIDANEAILRPISNNDTECFIEYVTNKSFGRLSPFGNLSKKEAEDLVTRLIARTKNENRIDEFWIIESKENKDFVGFIGYEPVIFEDTLQEMIFVGFKKNFLRSHIPKYAAEAFTKYAFEHNNISKLIAFIHPEDAYHINIAKSLGYIFEKECLFFDANVHLFILKNSN